MGQINAGKRQRDKRSGTGVPSEIRKAQGPILEHSEKYEQQREGFVQKDRFAQNGNKRQGIDDRISEK